MKKIIASLAIITALFVAASAHAQPVTISTNASGGITYTTNAVQQTTLDKIISLVGSPTNYAIEPYFTYAPKAPSKVGGGVLAVLDVNQYVGLALGVDYLGQLSLVSGNVTLSLPYHPFPKQFPNLLLTPFVLGGVGQAYSGAGNFNGAAATILDAGAAFKFGHLFGGQFNIGGSYGAWNGIGSYDVKRYHVFAGWEYGF